MFGTFGMQQQMNNQQQASNVGTYNSGQQGMGALLGAQQSTAPGGNSGVWGIQGDTR
jgi:hypothetical protein